MVKKGNSDIGHTKRYSPEQRMKISKLTQEEWVKKGADFKSGAEFAAHMRKVYAANGIKSPEGKGLSIRTVRFQIQRSGISFREAYAGGTARPAKLPPVAAKNGLKVTQVEAETESLVMPEDTRIVGCPSWLRSFLTDDSLTDKQKVLMVKAAFGIND